MYVVVTSHQNKDDVLSEPMPFEKAMAQFADLTGEAVEEMVEGEELSIGKHTIRPAKLAELVVDKDGVRMLDHIIEGFDENRFMAAFHLAVNEFGGIYTDDIEDEEFVAEFSNQLKIMAVSDLVANLVVQGHVEELGALDSGEMAYASTSETPIEALV